MTQAIYTQSVKVSSQAADGVLIDAFLAVPEGAGPFPAIVVIQEIFGVNAHIRDVAERLAREGYVAIAPAIYQRLAPGYESGYSEAEVVQGRVYKEQTKAEELLGDVAGAIAYLQNLPQVKAEAIGCIGFCFGGHVAYLAATLPEVKATASFYGAGLTTWIPGGGAPTVSRTGEIAGTLYAFFGMTDASIPAEQVDEIEAALGRQGVEHRVWRYAGAGHGFFCDRRGSYNPEAAADAWERVKALFGSLVPRLPPGNASVEAPASGS
jgi:carboxymethylenebutenolidase